MKKNGFILSLVFLLTLTFAVAEMGSSPKMGRVESRL